MRRFKLFAWTYQPGLSDCTFFFLLQQNNVSRLTNQRTASLTPVLSCAIWNAQIRGVSYMELSGPSSSHFVVLCLICRIKRSDLLPRHSSQTSGIAFTIYMVVQNCDIVELNCLKISDSSRGIILHRVWEIKVPSRSNCTASSSGGGSNHHSLPRRYVRHWNAYIWKYCLPRCKRTFPCLLLLYKWKNLAMCITALFTTWTKQDTFLAVNWKVQWASTWLHRARVWQGVIQPRWWRRQRAHSSHGEG